MSAGTERLHTRDIVLLTLFCVVLFGFSAFSGRPLTTHEARLPQTAREMQVTHNWLLPHSGTRPWLERPPLPHWLTIAVTTITGHNDRILFVRWASGLMGLLTVLLVTWMAAGWFGRSVGILSGAVLATMFEFHRYAMLAEDDIYLALLVTIAMALFAKIEFFDETLVGDTRTAFSAGRSCWMLAFFAVTGLTALTKGPLLGALIVASTVGLFELLTLDRRRRLRFVWLWGWLAMLSLTLAWPLLAYKRYPDVLDNWKYDYLGRMSGAYSAITQPWWYYAAQLPACLAPWAPISLIAPCWTWLHVSKGSRGILESAAPTSEDPRPGTGHVPPGAERFLWIWAIVPPLIFSLPQGKHHHYLLPILAPWAILTAVSLDRIGVALTKPILRATVASVLIALLLIYSAVAFFFSARSDRTLDDTQFTRDANRLADTDKPLFINADVDSLDFFRLQFYSRGDAILLHNLTFLRDESIHDQDVFVISRARDRAKLASLGDVSEVIRSKRSHDDGGSPEGRFALFWLRFDPDLKRYPAPTRITNMQGLLREKGPFCGPDFDVAQARAARGSTPWQLAASVRSVVR